MEKNMGDKSEKRISVKMLILVITTLPLLLACIVITFFSGWIINDGLNEQVFAGLQNAATGALISLDSVSSESFTLEDGKLYKGDYNVTDNMGLIDYYAESNDVEITFFYGDTRKATTIKDDKGERIVDTKAGDKICDEVLDKGNTYTSTDAVVNGEDYYGYYMPVRDTDENIIGMVFAGRARGEISHYITARIIFIVIIAAIMYFVCVILSFVVSDRKFILPIRKLSNVARELAKGNINQKIEKESNNEFGDLTDDFILLMDNIGKQAHVAERMADGDLTVKYTPASEVDVMGHAIVKMVDDNNTNLGIISGAAARMVTGAQEISTASNSLAEGTTEQASAIEEITASIEGIAQTAKVNAEDAAKADGLVKKTKEEAALGNEQMKNLIKAMDDINESSENISKIMKIIDDISFQTNIIALNASVEAARAGVHGKGFAVVAEEVRSLAGKSAEAAKNSAEMIEDSIKKVKIGSRLAAETETALEEIHSSVENVAGIVDGIAQSSGNQSASVSQVNAGIMQIANVVQTNSATSQQCAASSTELANLADQLRMAVDRYKLDI